MLADRNDEAATRGRTQTHGIQIVLTLLPRFVARVYHENYSMPIFILKFSQKTESNCSKLS